MLTAIGTDARASALALQPDGRAILAGGSATDGVLSLALARYLPSAPQVGSFTAAPNPVAAGSLVTLTAGDITGANPGATVTGVAFYYVDGSGIEQFLGYAADTDVSSGESPFAPVKIARH